MLICTLGRSLPLPGFLSGFLLGPLIIALTARRYTLILGALANSVLLLFCLPFILWTPGSPSQSLKLVFKFVWSEWFSLLFFLCVVQILSLIVTVPAAMMRGQRPLSLSKRSRF